MDNLKSIINHIKNQYPQESILLREYDTALNSFIGKFNPKYLFRGVRIYPSTKSNYHGLLINDYDRKVLHA